MAMAGVTVEVIAMKMVTEAHQRIVQDTQSTTGHTANRATALVRLGEVTRPVVVVTRTVHMMSIVVAEIVVATHTFLATAEMDVEMIGDAMAQTTIAGKDLPTEIVWSRVSTTMRDEVDWVLVEVGGATDGPPRAGVAVRWTARGRGRVSAIARIVPTSTAAR